MPLTQEQPGGNRPRNRLEKRKPGRPEGTMTRLAASAIRSAQEQGALPHELLLAWARGEPMSRKVLRDGGDPSKQQDWELRYYETDADAQRDSAKAAAPYYAPKISTVEVITGVSDANLDELIARAAAEAGLGVAPLGEGQARADEDQ